MEQTSHDSIYCYPGTDVLKNKYNQRDEDQLDKIERVLSGARLIDLYKRPIKGDFDINHLKKIHGYLFQDVYSWAGVIRTVDISKGVPFCHAAYIEKELTKLFSNLKKESFLKGCTYDELCYNAGFYLSEINAIHPFRDGNGRTQREFIRELLLPLGYSVDYSRCDPHLMFEASVAFFGGNDTIMTSLFKQCTIATIDK